MPLLAQVAEHEGPMLVWLWSVMEPIQGATSLGEEHRGAVKGLRVYSFAPLPVHHSALCL